MLEDMYEEAVRTLEGIFIYKDLATMWNKNK
jgi:hypothetical protein